MRVFPSENRINVMSMGFSGHKTPINFDVEFNHSR